MPSPPKEIAQLIIGAVGDRLAPYTSVLTSVINASKITEHIRRKPGFGQLTKADSSPVTVADLAAQMAVVNGIREAFSDDLIIAEEESGSLQDGGIRSEISEVLSHFDVPFNEFKDLGEVRGDSKVFWTIDPIDGTKGFLRNGQYAICVARVENEQVDLSMVACPNLNCTLDNQTGVLFLALKQLGVFEVSLHTGQSKRLPARTDPLKGSTMVESLESGHTSHAFSTSLREALGLSSVPLQLDSQCKYGMLARGEGSIYLRKPKEGYQEKIWDHAPGWLLVKEAGGMVSDFTGNDLGFTPSPLLHANDGILATMYSPTDHEKLIGYFKSL